MRGFIKARKKPDCGGNAQACALGSRQTGIWPEPSNKMLKRT
jgi:hypothetical protein